MTTMNKKPYQNIITSYPKVPLSDCCTIVSGSTPRRDHSDYWGGDIPWITPKDISLAKEKILASARENITFSGMKSCSTQLLPKGSVLFSSRAPIGLVAIAGIELCTNQGFKSLVPASSVDSSYLYHCMLYHAEEISRLGNGATFKEISKEIISNFKIPLPLLEEQRHIAAILDKADAIRRKRQEALKLADTFLKSVFLDMFGDPVTNEKGWEVVPFDFGVDIDTKMTKNFFRYAELLHVGIENIEKDTGAISGCLSAKDSGIISGKYLFTAEHIIYSKIRPNLNKVATPNFTGLCSADAYPMLVKKEIITKEYVVMILRSERFLQHVKGPSGRTNIPKVNKEQIRSFLFPLPPMPLQNKFAAIVQQVERQKKRMQQHLHEAEQASKALQQQFFG